jgi:GT2 family glycosyltransferase
MLAGNLNMKLSVLICTYKRHELLARSLAALLDGTQEKPDEIVVVNGGDERADAVFRSLTDAKSAHAGIHVKLIKTMNRNLATSRNVGLRQCTGDIVAMTDDDAEVFPDWVTQMKRVHHEHPDAGAVGGRVLGTNTDSLVGKVADAITFPSWDTAREVRTLPGVNISYKRAVLERIGYQDENLFRGEDVDYNWRVLQLGYKVYFDPVIKVYHYHRPTVKGFLNQHYMYGRAYLLVRRKWPSMYCIYPHALGRVKDILKAGHFVVGSLYQPLLSCRKLATLRDRLAALPLLFLAGLAWRAGMVYQAWLELLSRRKEAAASRATSAAAQS